MKFANKCVEYEKFYCPIFSFRLLSFDFSQLYTLFFFVYFVFSFVFLCQNAEEFKLKLEAFCVNKKDFYFDYCKSIEKRKLFFLFLGAMLFELPHHRFITKVMFEKNSNSNKTKTRTKGRKTNSLDGSPFPFLSFLLVLVTNEL